MKHHSPFYRLLLCLGLSVFQNASHSHAKGVDYIIVLFMLYLLLKMPKPVTQGIGNGFSLQIQFYTISRVGRWSFSILNILK